MSFGSCGRGNLRIQEHMGHFIPTESAAHGSRRLGRSHKASQSPQIKVEWRDPRFEFGVEFAGSGRLIPVSVQEKIEGFRIDTMASPRA